jgi:hypothetical protein
MCKVAIQEIGDVQAFPTVRGWRGLGYVTAALGV